MAQYHYKTKPFEHQRLGFEQTRDLESWAHFWDPRTGKSKVVIDTAAYNYGRGKIDGVLVVAPDSVRTNWVADEIPTHCPDWARPAALEYLSKRAKTKGQQRDFAALLEHEGLSFLCMSYSALVTERGAEAAKRFLTERKVLYVPDESHRIKTEPWKCKRTKYVLASGKHAVMRRILTGTPTGKGPFDVYHQIQFLDPTFWKEHGFASYTAFKTHFGVWETAFSHGRRYQAVAGYRNLEQLNKILAEVSDRIRWEDVSDMPPMVYTKRYFEMSPQQTKVYEQLRDRYKAELSDGNEVTAELPIVRLLRLQQITSGYVPADEGGEMHMIPGSNPRLGALLEVCEDTPGQAIIWARFRLDIDIICAGLRDAGFTVGRYDGAVAHELRKGVLDAFQGGETQFIVANPAMAGEGIPLHAANTMIYYNRSPKLIERKQSEDRAKHQTKTVRVGVVDIICPGTVDDRVVACLRENQDVASAITGDKLREWL